MPDDRLTEAEAFALVSSSPHPSPEAGGPCATCAFRHGSEAARTEHTRMLAILCIGALEQFYCHEKTQLCRGWIAAVNLRGVPDEKEREAAALGAEVLGMCIELAKKAEAT